MTQLRKRMLEELQRRDYSKATTGLYSTAYVGGARGSTSKPSSRISRMLGAGGEAVGYFDLAHYRRRRVAIRRRVLC